jgi:hypothetical protein
LQGSIRSEPWIINVEFSTNQVYRTSRKIGIQPSIKLATHQVETVTTLFALVDKYARAAEGCAWHTAP